MLYMGLKRFVVGPLVNLWFRPEAQGLENVPRSGAAILASNHLSFADSVFLPVAVDRQVYFLAKSEYFTGTGLRGRVVAAFFRGINQIPMDRSGGERSARSLGQAEQTLREGNLLGIYPEGTRSPDGRMYRPKLGVARLALRTGVPVIPVAMIGTDRAQPAGSLLPRRRAADRPGAGRGERVRVRTVIGEPLDFSEFRGREEERAVQRQVADRIMLAVRELSGQEYVDVYASSVKSLMEKQRMADARAAAAQLLEKARARTQATVETVREKLEEITSDRKH